MATMTKQEFDKLVISKAVADAFQLADNSSATFMDTLLSEGIGTREDVRLYAMKWAEKKYGERVTMGQRGLKLPRDGAAEQAVKRILRAVFNSGESKKQKKSAPVRFTRAQRSACDLFLAEFEGETKAAQIRQAKALLNSLQ